MVFGLGGLRYELTRGILASTVEPILTKKLFIASDIFLFSVIGILSTITLVIETLDFLETFNISRIPDHVFFNI